MNATASSSENAGGIPIRNLFYLLSYAWDEPDLREEAELGDEKSGSLLNALARVYLQAFKSALHHGLERTHQTIKRRDDIIRGRFLPTESLGRGGLETGRVVCLAPELSFDTPLNQMVKATLLELANAEPLDVNLRGELIAARSRLRFVSEIPLRLIDLHRIVLHRNNRPYRILANLSALLKEYLLPSTQAGRTRLLDPRLNDRRMAMLAQHFILGFANRELDCIKAKAESFSWDWQSMVPEQVPLPSLNTDVTINFRGRTHLVETKFYRSALQVHHDRESYHSGNLFQLHAYLSNRKRPAGEALLGVLLYAGTGREIHDRFESIRHGYDVEVHALDLDREWRDIDRDLRRMLNGEWFKDRGEILGG